MPALTRRLFTAGLLAAPAIARAQEPIRLRCSLDTAPTHGRNVAIGDYLKKLEAASDGRIKPEIFASGQRLAIGVKNLEVVFESDAESGDRGREGERFGGESNR